MTLSRFLRGEFATASAQEADDGSCNETENDGMEEGIWLNSCSNRLDWTGLIGASPVETITMSLDVAVYPVDEEGIPADFIDPPIQISAQTKATPGAWTVEQLADEPGIKALVDGTSPQKGDPADTHVDLLAGPIGGIVKFDEFPLVASSIEGYITHRRIWFERKGCDSTTFRVKVYFNYGTPFPSTFAEVAADYPVNSDYRVVLKATNWHSGATEVVDEKYFDQEYFGVNRCMFSPDLETDGDKWRLQLNLEIKEPGDDEFTPFRFSEEQIIDLDPDKEWLPPV